MALEKGTAEWMFWSDFFQFCKKYWDVREDDEYWLMITQDADKLYRKYNSYLSKKLILAFLDVQSKKYQGKI